MKGVAGRGSRVLGLCSLVLGLWSLVSPAAAERPRVGLALSGGSALGLAHIGVIQWLEEHHIPVEAVAGTSIGGLVGAMYATGMSPEEMRSLAESIDWDEIFARQPPYESLSFRRKEDRILFPGGVSFGLCRGFRLPSGLNPAQPVNLLLSRLAFPYSDLPSFDALPIPFRSVAVDLVSGQRVVMGRGSLALALRATMAIPGLFTPVEYNRKVLVDGGLLDNFPVGVARGMGTDMVIGVNVLAYHPGGEFLESPLGVLNRSVDAIVRHNVQEGVQLADVVVPVDLRGFSGTEYDRASELADAGYRAAAATAEKLLPYRVDQAAWNAYISARSARRRSSAFTPRFLQLAGACTGTCLTVTQTLQPFVGKPLALRKLEDALVGLTGLGRVESLLYEKTHEGNEEGLLIYLREKDYGPPFVDATLDVNGATTEAVQFNIPVRLTQFDVGAPGAELRTDVTLGSRTRLAMEYYRPMSARGWFIAPRVGYDHYVVPYASLQRSEGGYGLRKLAFGLDTGRYYGRDSELRLGIDAGHADFSPRNGSVLSSADGRFSFLSARWTADHQNDAVVPTRGARFHLDARWYLRAPGGDRNFPSLAASATEFRPLGNQGTLFLLGSVGSTFGGHSPLVSRSDTISPLRLGPIPAGDPYGSHHLLLGAGYLRSVSRLPAPLGSKVYLGAWYTHGGLFSDWESAHLAGSLTTGALAETAAGPVFVGVSWAEGTQRIHFAIGRFLKSDAP